MTKLRQARFVPEKNQAERQLFQTLSKISKKRLVNFIKTVVASDGRMLPHLEILLAEGDRPKAVALAKRQLADLRRSRKFRFGAGTAELATELEQILDGIAGGIAPHSPLQALEFVAAFIETDAHVFEQADDSYGQIGSVFRRACDLFGTFAQECPSQAVLPLLRRLCEDDGYGARGTLVRATVPALDAPTRSKLIDAFRHDMGAAKDLVANPAVIGLMEAADAIGDPELYEEACLFMSRGDHPVFRLHVAQRYLRAGRPQESLERMPTAAAECGGYAQEWEDTHVNLLRALGRTDELRERLWVAFAKSPTKAALDAWMATASKDRHSAMIAQAQAEVRRDTHSPERQAAFFAEIGELEQAAECILRRPSLLDGNRYYELPPLAKALAVAHPLASCAIYRALVASNLVQAKSKYYPHGVRYWRQLESLAPRITDWGHLPSHESYAAAIRMRHARNTAFWGLVDAHGSADAPVG